MKKTLSVLLFLFIVTALWAWNAGDRVLGEWSDGYWYPATISSVEDEIFKVDYFDGDSADLSASQVKSINWGVGTVLECNWKSEGGYYKGTITTMDGDSIHVSYNDGDQEDTTIGKCRSE